MVKILPLQESRLYNSDKEKHTEEKYIKGISSDKVSWGENRGGGMGVNNSQDKFWKNKH